MSQAHVLDRFIGAELPALRDAAELAAFEATPYADRIIAQSTFDALQIGAAIDPQAAAIKFLRKADPDEQPLTISYRDFIARVTQTANLLTDLGVGPGDVVSMLLPLVPQAFFTLFGAQAAGIANPVNPLLSAGQIGEILRAADTRVLVTLGPVPGSDIWDKVQAIKGSLPNLNAIVVVHGAADAAQRVHDFDSLIDRQPADRLASRRRIAATDIAGCFHTGGTTGTPKLVRHTHANQVYQAWAMALMLPTGAGGSLLFFRHPAVALAALVGQPDPYAGELPVAFVQLKPGAKVSADELLDHVRQHTPERAAVPAQVFFVDAIALTAVGKVFKPALRWQAAQRAVATMLGGLAPQGANLEVEVGAHAEHGSMITVAWRGVVDADRQQLAQQTSERLDPLVMRHEIVWR